MTSSLSFRTGRSVEFGRVLFALVLVSACGSFSFAPAIWAQTAHAGGATIALGGGFGGGAYTGPVGVAVDGSGNVYVAILEASLVKKIPPGCGDSSCVQTLGGGFDWPYGVGVDASGNVYVADTGNNAVKEMPRGCGDSSCVQTLGGGFSLPIGVAVDAGGNVYVVDNNGVKGMPSGCGDSSCVRTLGGGWTSPYSVAVDGGGNVYVGDFGSSYGTSKATEMGPGCGDSSCVQTLGGGFSSVEGVTVDGSGNVYVIDPYSSAVKEMPPGCADSSCVHTLRSGFNWPMSVAVDSGGNVYVADYHNFAVYEVLTGGAVTLPSTAVGSTSAAVTVSFTFDTTGQIGAPVALAQGATGLDFAEAGTGTCTTSHTYNPGDTCTVDVKFTPRYPGQRLGAVQLTTATTPHTVIATNLVYGTGTGPLATFPSNTTVRTLGGGWWDPRGVAVDGSGNVYIADTGNYLVKEMPPGCSDPSCVQTLGGDFLGPFGVAVDGSGNVYVADSFHSAVKEMPPGCGDPSCVRTLGGGFNHPTSVAVDGIGSVYVADIWNSAVNEIPPGCGDSSCVHTLGGGFSAPFGVAVDGGGNVYVADLDNNAVKEMPRGCGDSSCVHTLGGGFNGPTGVAVDGAGNVYVADNNNNKVKEMPRGCGDSSCVHTLGGFNRPADVVLDGSGNVFVAAFNAITQIDRSDAPSLTFADTSVGSTSADSPHTVTLANIGNAPLSFPIFSWNNPGIASTNSGLDFRLDTTGATTCPLVTSASANPRGVAAGASCTLPISFTPHTAGNITGALTLWDTSLNAGAPGYATQAIALSGNGIKATPVFNDLSSPTIAYGQGPTTFSGTIVAGALAPAGASVTIEILSTASQCAATIAADGSFSCSISTTALPAAGYTVTYAFGGDANFNAAAAGNGTLTIGRATPIINWNTPSDISYTTPLSSAQLNATASVPGTLTYSPAAGMFMPPGIQTLSVGFTPDDPVDYTTATATVSLNVTPSAIAIGSSSPQTVYTLTFATGGTLDSINVLTQGEPNLDFQQASGGTCTVRNDYTGGDTCTVLVTFTPRYPGQQLGAVVLSDISGSKLAASYISGTGLGPLATFPSNTMVSTLGGGFSYPWGEVVDGSGNLYVSDFGNNAVKEILAAGGYTIVNTLGGGITTPAGIAVDGAGNVYVADYWNSTVKEMPPGCGDSGCVHTLGGGFGMPSGVAVDGGGNVFVADFGDSTVKEMPPGCGDSSCVQTLGGGFMTPAGVAVDGAGNVYVADTGNGAVKEMPRGCGDSSCVQTLGGGFGLPVSVVVDAGGNVYVADQWKHPVMEIPPGCVTASCVHALGSFPEPNGIAVDGSGNVYVADIGINAIRKIDLRDAPSLTFADTSYGSTSADSPQTVTLANIGNAPLSFPIFSWNNPGIASTNSGLDFGLDSTGATACPLVTSASANPGSLAAGASCTLPISFIPQAVGNITGALTLWDSNLNAGAPSYATQAIALSGNGIKATPVFNDLSSPTITYGQGPATFSGTIVTGVLAPAGDSVTIKILSTTSQCTATIAADGSFSCSISTAALPAAGYTVKYDFGGDANFNAAATGNGTLTVGKAALTVAAANAQMSYGASVPSLSGTLTGVIADDGITAGYSTTATSGSAVGGYPITPVLKDPNGKLGNYALTSTNGTLTIGKAALTVAAANAQMTYGASVPSLSGTLTGVAAGDRITASYSTTATSASAVGSYSITPVLNDPNGRLGNYAVTSTNGILTVGKAALTVAAANAQVAYGASVPSLSGTLTGVAAGDRITASYSTTATSGSAVGGYPITPVLNDPNGKLGNYAVTSTNGILTIGKASLTVAAANAQMTYGASVPSLSGTLTGVPAGDGITAGYSTTATSGSAVGGYPITPVLNDPNGKLGNYVVTSTNGTLTIGKAALTVAAANAQMSYGASVPSLSGTLTGVLAGDGITARYSTTATSASAVGGYPITPVLNDPNGKFGNYTVISTNGTLTIGKANSLIVLQASAAMVLIDNNVTLTAEVTSTTSGAPTGSVNFMDGSTSLGSSMLDNTGIAVLTLSTLASGAHSVTAVYAGDSSFNNITSGAVIETVQDFQLSGGSGGGSGTVLSATVLPGGIAIYQLQVAPTNGSSFPSAITLSLSGLPPGASYTITPATIAAGSGAQTVVVQVQTVRPLASLHNAPAVSPFLAFGMVLPMLGIVRLRRAMQRREKRRALWLLLLALTTLGMGACGGGSGFFNNAQQTYKMSLTATSGAAQHSINLSLTVQ